MFAKLSRYRLPAILIIIAAAIFACGGNEDNGSGSVLTPIISGMTPAQVSLGQRNVEGRIQGQNLSGVVSVNLGASIDVLRVQVLSATEVLVEFSVGRDAQSGARTITVTTASTTVQSAGAVLTVQNNQVPVAKFSINPRTAGKNSLITFDASASTDQDGTIQGYRWSFGDGASANGKVVTHKYAAAGNYDIQLTVSDNNGGSGFNIQKLDVQNNQGPVARFTMSPAQGDTNTEFTFDGSDSSDNDGKVVKYAWNFGDGSKTEGKVAKHVFANDKTYTVLLTVTDNDGATGQKDRDVKVDRASGGGGGCSGRMFEEDANSCGGFTGQLVCVVAVQGNVITTSSVVRRCPGLCGEFRRNGDGIREFVGDIARIDGTKVTLNYGRLPASTRPKAGEKIRAIWRPCH